MRARLILIILFCYGVQTMAQTVYNYRSREYYTYNEAKKLMVLDTKDKVRTSLTIDDQKKRILFKINGVEETAIFEHIIIKGPISANNGNTFLLFIHKDERNEEIHFYISKEAARIESYGSMVQLFE
ncbi:MAG: hypothetical protein WBN17_11140 [Aureibaculum sp.]